MNLQRPRQTQQQNSTREKYAHSQYQHNTQGYQRDLMIIVADNLKTDEIHKTIHKTVIADQTGRVTNTKTITQNPT